MKVAVYLSLSVKYLLKLNVTAGEDFDRDLALDNIDFGVYVSPLCFALRLPLKLLSAPVSSTMVCFDTFNVDYIVHITFVRYTNLVRRTPINIEYLETCLSPSRIRQARTLLSNNGVWIGSRNTQHVHLLILRLISTVTDCLPAAKKAGKPVVLEEFGVSGIGIKITTVI